MKLFVSSKVESRIAALKKAGKSGKTLAQKVTSILDSLASGDLRKHMDMDKDVDSFLPNLTNKDLRSVFKGLIEGARKGL